MLFSRPTRVPGLPIGDCAEISNNLVPRGTKLSAIDVTSKAIFERLYVVLGLSPFEPRVKCPYTPTLPPLTRKLFLDFRAIVFPSGPSFFYQHTIHQVIWPSPGTLRPTEIITETWENCYCSFLCSFTSTNPLRVEFHWKLIVGIPGMQKLLFSPWQTLGVPFALTPIGQLHQSPPSPVPGDLRRYPSDQSHVTRK